MARLPDVIDLDGRSHIKALLGPTNTGKTHRAIERMLYYTSGMIGLPLRLLAREVYDRVCERVGAEKVALVTGEERIVPSGARYFCCTVESMPVSRHVAFLAVDEIQLATHRERGHVFTDRLLNARGVRETWFLGSDTMVPVVERLVPTAEIVTFPRLSALRYAGVSRLTALRPRSAVVAFSAAQVYELAERLRATQGGTAVVLGALSPRARNAQVALYQSGEVKYLVSTDAIGMGLNLDVHHLALGALTKFDGAAHRMLSPAELGQIAGRAGRFRRDGSFGITAQCAESTGGLDPAVIEAIETQRFEPVQRVYFRSSALDFSSGPALLASLAAPPALRSRMLMPKLDGVDHDTLRRLLAEPEAQSLSESALALLWEVCRVPDFQGGLGEGHLGLVRRLFWQLQHHGTLSPTWVEEQLARLDRVDGGLEELMARIAFTRTWAYVAHREGWLDTPEAWRERTRLVEERLSDALHELLTQRFVDQRAVVLMEQFEAGLPLTAEVTAEGEVRAAGVRLGRLEGFSFAAEEEAGASAAGIKAVRRAARQALEGLLAERVQAAIDADHLLLVVDEEGRLRQGASILAHLVAGEGPLAPKVRMPHHELLSTAQREALRRRAEQWVREEVARLSAPLDAAAAGLHGPAAGLLYRLLEALGTLPREDARELVEALSPEDRKALYRLGVRLGVRVVYAQPLLKPDMVARRARLWGLWQGLSPLPVPPPTGATSAPTGAGGGSAAFSAAVGYLLLGSRVVRVDMVERLDARLREATRAGAAPLPAAEGMSWLGCTAAELISVCRALGYEVTGEDEAAILQRPRPRGRGRSTAAPDRRSRQG